MYFKITDPIKNSVEDAAEFTALITNSINNLMGLITGKAHFKEDADIEEDTVYSFIKIIIEPSEHLQNWATEAKDTIQNHLKSLYNFVVSDLNDIQYKAEAGNAISFFRVLQEVDIIEMATFRNQINVSDIDKNFTFSCLPRISEALEYAQAKYRLHENKTIDVASIATLADITTMGVMQAIKRGNLAGKKSGNTWLIASKAALEWLNGR